MMMRHRIFTPLRRVWISLLGLALFAGCHSRREQEQPMPKDPEPRSNVPVTEEDVTPPDVEIRPGSQWIEISSMAELVEYAAKSGNRVKMKPGIYQMQDYLTPEVIKKTLPHATMVEFSGSRNQFDLTGVTIEVNTELLNDFGNRVVREFFVSGNRNLILGLTVTDIGNAPTARGGQSMDVGGEQNTVKNITLHVSGSAPYGYGDLLGKGDRRLVRMQKHSGLRVTGLNIRVLDCSIYSKSFGHLFFVQGGRDVLFENCYAEAVTRTTDEMLAETSGPAFERGFASVYGDYQKKKRIPPGYTKSLSECGFRNYGAGAMTFVNCRAKNTRVGFELTRRNGDVHLRNCEATGCEVGYSLTGVTVIDSRGDAANGPLLYLNGGQRSRVDLALMPATNPTTIHALATIAGDDHVVNLTKWQNQTREQVHPILVGYRRPAGCNPFSPLGTSKASRIHLTNDTGMPVKVASTVRSSSITSNGPVTDKGVGNTVTKVGE